MVGFWETPMHKNAKWNADVKSNHRHDAADFITGRGSKWNGDKRHENVDRRIANRQDKRAMRKAAAAAEKSGLCSAMIIGGALAAAGIASNIAKAKGWA
jgi:hypothetical protein